MGRDGKQGSFVSMTESPQRNKNIKCSPFSVAFLTEAANGWGEDGLVSQTGYRFEGRISEDLPIPGWRLHIIKSRVGVSEPNTRCHTNDTDRDGV